MKRRVEALKPYGREVTRWLLKPLVEPKHTPLAYIDWRKIRQGDVVDVSGQRAAFVEFAGDPKPSLLPRSRETAGVIRVPADNFEMVGEAYEHLKPAVAKLVGGLAYVGLLPDGRSFNEDPNVPGYLSTAKTIGGAIGLSMGWWIPGEQLIVPTGLQKVGVVEVEHFAEAAPEVLLVH